MLTKGNFSEVEVSPKTLKAIKQVCNPSIENGSIPKQEFDNLLKMANQNSKVEVSSSKGMLISRKKAAEMLSVCTRTLDRLADEGKLTRIYLKNNRKVQDKNGVFRKLGGRIRFRLEEVENLSFLEAVEV